MRINADLVMKLRKRRSWSQDELAIAAGLNLRTVQRIERDGSASLQSKKAVAAALEINAQDLELEEATMKTCSICDSKEIYQYKEFYTFGMNAGEPLLPRIGGVFSWAKIRPTICANCGNVRFFVDEDSRKKLKASKHWKPV